MKLYGHPRSGHSFKVKFCLEAAGIEHDYEVIDIFSEKSSRNAEFIEKSKFCEVPLLVDEETNLIQSNAILVYIATKYGVYGASSDSELQSCLEWLVWEANKIGMCLPQLIADKKMPGWELNVGVKEWLLARYTNDVAVIDNQFADGRRYIIGDHLTIADFSLSGYLMYAQEAEVSVPKNIALWLHRLMSIDGWASPHTMLAANS